MLSADDWPIAASLLPLGDAHPRPAAGGDTAERWRRDLEIVWEAGFDHVDLTDSWTRFGDLTADELADLRGALAEIGVTAPSLSAIRRSIIDEVDGDDHLAYAHRTIDAAVELGVGVVSFGLHRALTPEQREQLWFWTVPGHRDPVDDPDTWQLAVTRFRELGRHAADVGVLVSLEMYEHTYLGTGSSAVRLVEDIGLDTVGLNPDIGNIVRLHEPIEDWREIAAATLPYTNFWHVKNYTRDEDLAAGIITTVPSYLESGIIDYRSAFAMALDAGFQGVICTEHYGGDGLSMSAANRDYLRSRILPRRPRTLGTSRVQQQFGGESPR